MQEITAGIVLTGPEVKSIKQGNANLKGAHVTVSPEGNVLLMNAHIAPYPPAQRDQTAYQPDRSRVLLLTKKERDYLRGRLQERGITAVPLKIMSRNRLVKVTIGIVVGKKKHDKREHIKKRDIERSIRRTLRSPHPS